MRSSRLRRPRSILRLKQEVDEKIVAPVKEQLRKGVPKELLDIIDQLSSSPGTEDEAEQ